MKSKLSPSNWEPFSIGVAVSIIGPLQIDLIPFSSVLDTVLSSLVVYL